jgi:3-hydroxyacyl-CoA dehydrogenase/enoyl-CoA hydratase/carnithine racemase
MGERSITEFKLQWYASPRAGRLALVTMDNGQDHRKPTTFGREALASLQATLDLVEAAGDCKGLLLTGKPFVFAAGADLGAFAEIDTPAKGRASSRAGHEAFLRLQRLPCPTLAAINGAALGGGLEISLFCDYRTLSTSAAPLGFPEVFLSILPGWGGTQLAPRLLGARNALQVIVHNALNHNRLLQAQDAYELGLADRLIPAVDFLDGSLALLERLVTGAERIERELPPDEGLDEALASARQAADDRLHGATPAPYRAIELIEFAARGGALEEGLAREAEALAELVPARTAQAAIYSFNLTQQRVKRQPGKPEAEPRQVRRMGIVGSGLMGAQLGALFLQRFEVPLVMQDIDEAVLARAREHIEGELDKRVARGRLGEGKARFLKGVVTYATAYDALAGSDLVLEAAPERMDVKRSVLAAVEAVVDAGAVLASNTSSLSVSEMASGLAHPERVIGLHFFNPVAVMPLLEIIRAQRSSDEALATGFEVSKRLRKSGVLCGDSPAFIANRLMLRFNGAAMRALARGNDFTEIDDAIKALGLPMGPFELFGLVGLRVVYHTAETLHAAYPERFPLDETFRRIAALDVDGIYDWSRGRVPHDAVADAVVVEEGAERLTAEEIRAQALAAIADEAKFMLDEGAVRDARDIDTALLLGAGWPFFTGGPCRYSDDTGLSAERFGGPLVTETDRAFA